MADKTYKMVVTLSDGSTVDAGTFVAPQGPSGAFSDWQDATFDTVLQDGTYLIKLINTMDYFSNQSAVVTIENGNSCYFEIYTKILENNIVTYYGHFSQGKISAKADIVQLVGIDEANPSQTAMIMFMKDKITGCFQKYQYITIK